MKILWTSDQHTLHRTTPTYHVLSNLNTFFFEENDLATVDMIVFGGDFADRLVDASSNDLKMVLLWGKEFHRRYYELNPEGIVIWLEGTSSHDWGQPEHFLAVKPPEAKVLYRDTVTVEIFKEHNDLSVLYVPDNLGVRTIDEIWDMCLAALVEANLTKVDLVFLHGAFTFQLHPKVQHKGHDLERFESITRYGILAGHVHKPIQTGMLYTSGSFDRVAMGEMHAKGGLIINLDKTKDHFDVKFWENKKALPYVYLDIDEETKPEELIKIFNSFIKKENLPRNSRISIRGGRSGVVTPIINVLQLEHPQYGIVAKNTTDKDMIIKDTVIFTGKYQGITINRENILPSLLPGISNDMVQKGITEKDLKLVLEDFL